LISESNILNCFQHLVEDLENSNVILGPGDDAAVIKSNTKDLVHSLDISKVGTHFPEYSSPEDIAYRSVAVALSDLAAMGAYPSFISIGLSSNIKEIKWYERFTSGIEDILNEYKIKLVGGDVTFGEISICVNVFGYPYKSIVKRSGALCDDQIYITGPLGTGRKGLEDWKNKKKSNYVESFFRPKIQFDIAQFISNYATSCIDISDGLVKDLHSVCKFSKVGAIIHLNKNCYNNKI
jgi:thiamine-monophosphate kinase